MGEAKRKRERLSPVEQRGLEITRELAGKGQLVAGGFAAFVLTNKIDVHDPRMPALRDAYMSGAEHLWSSIMATLDAGTEPTDADLRRMDLIQTEIDAWRSEKMSALAQAMPTQGTA